MDAVKNFAVSTVATAPSPASSGTSLVVASGHGSRFPVVPFNAVIWPTATAPDSSNAEIVRVTAVSTDTLTIVRQQEGTSARTVVTGDNIAANITAAMLRELAEQWQGSFDGQGGVITSGSLFYRHVASNHTLSFAALVADVSGSVTVTVKRYTPSGGSLGSPTTLGTVALSSAQHNRDTTLSGWTKSVTAGDVLEISVGGTISSVTKLTVLLG